MDTLLHNPERRFCKKCGRELPKDHRYCLECYHKELNSSSNLMVYGPPFSVKYHCNSCGEYFLDEGMGRSEAEYCPFCGKKYDSVDSSNGDRPNARRSLDDIYRQWFREFKEKNGKK